MNAEDIARELGKASQSTDGWWLCLAPCHDDNAPSFTVMDDPDYPGRIRTNCHAGCDGKTRAAALRARGLWPGSGSVATDKAPRLRPPKKKKEQTEFVLPIPAGAVLPRPVKRGQKADHVWCFRDEAGRPLFFHARWNSVSWKDGGKDFAYIAFGKKDNDWVWEKPRISPLPIYGRSDLADKIAVVCEGEKTADAVSLIEGYQGITAGSKQDMLNADWSFLNSRPVVIFAPDKGDESVMETIAARLSGPEIRFVWPPESGAKGWDLADCSRDERADFLREAKPYHAEPVLPGTRVVPVGMNERPTLDACLEVLAQDRSLRIYTRMGGLVEVSPQGAIAQIDPNRIRVHLSERVQFQNMRGERIKVPPRLPETVLAWADYPQFPSLSSVVSHPCLLPGGRVLDRPGYDQQTGTLFVDSGRVFPRIPERPTRDQAVQAAREIMADFADFPFEEESDRAAFLSYFLSVFARDAIAGSVPSFLNTANEQGAGKSLLAESPWRVANGKGPSMISGLPRDEEEMQKKVTGLLMRGDRAIIFDNVTTKIQSESLATLVTGEEYTGRVLGKTDMRGFPNNWIVCITCNNPAVDLDQISRSVFIRLLAPPGNRERSASQYRNPMIKEHLNGAAAHCSRAVTILKAFYDAGMPDQGARSLRDFHAWTRLISGAVMWCGFPDPLLKQAEAGQDADSDSEAWGALIRFMLTSPVVRLPDEFTAGDLVEESRHHPRLADLLIAVVPGSKSPDARTVGYALRRVCKKNFDGYMIEKGARGNDGTRWRIAKKSSDHAPLPHKAEDAIPF